MFVLSGKRDWYCYLLRCVLSSQVWDQHSFIYWFTNQTTKSQRDGSKQSTQTTKCLRCCTTRDICYFRCHCSRSTLVVFNFSNIFFLVSIHSHSSFESNRNEIHSTGLLYNDCFSVGMSLVDSAFARPPGTNGRISFYVYRYVFLLIRYSCFDVCFDVIWLATMPTDETGRFVFAEVKKGLIVYVN